MKRGKRVGGGERERERERGGGGAVKREGDRQTDRQQTETEK